MAAAGFSVQHGAGQTEVSIVSDNAKGLKVRTSSTVAPSTAPAQNSWHVSSKFRCSSSRVCKWQSSESSTSDMTEPEWDSSSSEFYEQESGGPLVSAPGPVTAHRPHQEPDHEQKEHNVKMSSVVVKGFSSEFYEQESGGPLVPPPGTITVPPVTDHRPPPQEEPDQEQKYKMSSVVVAKKENNADHQEEGEHIPPRPLVKKLIQVLAYPATAVLKGHRGRRSPTKAPAAA